MLTRDRIADQLRRRIAAGDFQAEADLPSERALAETLGVSRMTVRAAIDHLIEEGVLVRRPNRRPLVAGDKINRSANFMSFSEEMRARGWQVRSELRAFASAIADLSVAAQLEVESGATVIYLERLRFADEMPLALEKVYLPFKRFQRLLTLDLADISLYETLEREFGVRPVHAEESIEAVLLDAAEAALFKTALGIPGLLTRRVTRDEEGLVVEAAMSLYRGDKYRMVLSRGR